MQKKEDRMKKRIFVLHLKKKQLDVLSHEIFYESIYLINQLEIIHTLKNSS